MPIKLSYLVDLWRVLHAPGLSGNIAAEASFRLSIQFYSLGDFCRPSIWLARFWLMNSHCDIPIQFGNMNTRLLDHLLSDVL